MLKLLLLNYTEKLITASSVYTIKYMHLLKLSMTTIVICFGWVAYFVVQAS